MKTQSLLLTGTLFLTLLLRASSPTHAQSRGIEIAAQLSTQLALSWSTRVHHSMIQHAFGDEENMECLAAMKRGSDYTDESQFQEPGLSYMHAMRAKGQSVSDAAKKMREFIEQNFQLARRAPDAEQRCFYRGVALHPVMDSTSPAHSGFQQWDPIPFQSVAAILKALLIPGELKQKLPHMLQHGDLVKRITDYLPLLVDTSLEDFDYLDDHPQLFTSTVEYLRVVDRIQFDLMRELERVTP